MRVEEELNRSGILIYPNKGYSMWPLIRQGRDLMIIEKKEPPYHKYDPVLFKRKNGQYVMHRILRVCPKANPEDAQIYWIVGDNCISGEMVEESRILGILTGRIRGEKEVRFAHAAWYPFYVFFWCRLYPLRIFLLRCRRKAGRIVRIFIPRRQ